MSSPRPKSDCFASPFVLKPALTSLKFTVTSLKLALTSLLLLGLFSSTLSLRAQTATGQVRPTAADAPACDHQRALALVQQQAADSRSFENVLARIRVMLRAADLLWPYQTEAARAIFADAYELAALNFQQKGDAIEQQGQFAMQLPDQRFVVMSAIARRDPAWARRLAERAAEETRREAEKAASTQQSNPLSNVGNKMIDLAQSLLAIDEQTALALARNLEDKQLRATAILALSARCLERQRNQNDTPAKKGGAKN